MYYTAIMVTKKKSHKTLNYGEGKACTDALFQIKQLTQLMMLWTNTSIVGSCLFIKCGQYL